MKRIQKYIFLLLIILQFQFVTYSQVTADAPPAEIDSGANPLDEPAAPIDNYLWIALITGIIFGIYAIRKSRKTAL